MTEGYKHHDAELAEADAVNDTEEMVMIAAHHSATTVMNESILAVYYLHWYCSFVSEAA